MTSSVPPPKELPPYLNLIKEEEARSINSALSPYYAVLFPALVGVARVHGYALAIHGSMSRDCDIIAVPWVEYVSAPIVLVRALAEVCQGSLSHSVHWPVLKEEPPTNKPHRRLSWCIYLSDRGGSGPYLDVSVMPPIALMA